MRRTLTSGGLVGSFIDCFIWLMLMFAVELDDRANGIVNGVTLKQWVPE